jgi:hypothetical protein
MFVGVCEFFESISTKMSEPSKNSQSAHKRFLSEKPHLGKFLGEAWRDLQPGQHWKYEQLSPIKLLQRSKRLTYPPDNDEVRRANWFWSLQPRWHQATSCILWLIVGLGLPLWLFVFPAIGVPLAIIAAAIANTGIVRSVRWRRQYELSIDRLLRTCENGTDPFEMDIFS